jgi:hypothetical protein
LKKKIWKKVIEGEDRFLSEKIVYNKLMLTKIKLKIASKVGGSLSKTIFKNASLNAFRTVFLAFLSFVTIPIILHKLGTENYGVWALVIAFALPFFRIVFNVLFSFFTEELTRQIVV